MRRGTRTPTLGSPPPVKSTKPIGSLGQGHTWSVQPSDTQAYLPRWSTSRSSDSHPHAPRTTCPSARGRRSHDPQTVPDLRPLDPSRTQSVTDINSSCRTDSSGGAAVHRRSRRSQSSCQSAQLFDERQRWSGREVPPLRPTWCGSCDEDRVSAGCDNCYALTLAKRLKAMCWIGGLDPRRTARRLDWGPRAPDCRRCRAALACRGQD